MLSLHLLTACLFFVVAQVAGNNERHLITFNKIDLGNLAALEILMHRGGYTHVHIILSGIYHVDAAVGHFHHWNQAVGKQRSPKTEPAVITYGGRPLDPGDLGEWYENSFLGIAQRPNKASLNEMKFVAGATYDIHQVVPTSLKDHQWLNDQILELDGIINRVFIQHGRDTEIFGNVGLPLHNELEKIYKHARNIVVIGTKSLSPAETSVALDKLDFRLPNQHLDRASKDASKDPFVANTLLRVSKLLHGIYAELMFLPKDLQENLRKFEPNENVRLVDLVRDIVREGLNGHNKKVKEKLEEWVPGAKDMLKKKLNISLEVHQRKYLKMLSNRLDGIALKLGHKKPKEDEVEFAEPMFAAALFSEKYEPQPFVPEEESEASASSSSGGHGSRADHGEPRQEIAVPIKAVVYEDLPRKELLKEALTYFTQEKYFGSYKTLRLEEAQSAPKPVGSIEQRRHKHSSSASGVSFYR
ncbi:hypothetical protein FA10DRAFT_288408 [Acaromyces ingoldii]|uniref:Uncharacterized protein n=1 Tax=Acaromyces ingoldii TaxID=215250 RepID=A0A316YHU8_9BASI|nr:hypothetical protein FA10DRAFT_288408 [Acaromyces ingoldii]PWN87683.1 hypothetical protein FA10DRAFT_288408 [Acaromyces ingoldii]